MTKNLQLIAAHANEDATNIVLTGVDETGQSFDVCFQEEAGDQLLAALVSILGQRARQRTGDNTLKRVLPLEWWEINPHPERDGLLLSFCMPGGMEMTFHLGASAVPLYEEVLSTLTGTQKPPVPEGREN
jgi:hypothetical protein